MNVLPEVPQSVDAEKGVLCSCILNSELLDEMVDFPEDSFCHPAHKRIFEALREMHAKHCAIDLITLTQWLEDRGILEEVGGAGAVTDLSMFIPTPANFRYYIDIVREKWVRRRVLKLSQSVSALAYAEVDNSDELLAQVEGSVLGFQREVEGKKQDRMKQCKESAMEALDHLDLLYKNKGSVIGMSTGIVDWDRMTGGLQGGDMITIAGRPSHGKSALGMSVALHVALESQKPVLVFSVEMPSKQLMVRAICGRARINLQNVRYGFMPQKDMSNIIRVTNELSESKLYIDDTAGLTTAQFSARARRAKARWGIELIVVDYLQFMHGSSKRAKDSRQLEVSEISATIKNVAKELNVPIIALAQLNRDADDYAQPKLSHLRESGSIEQDSDMVLLIHRLDKKKSGKKDEDEEELDYNVELLLEKQRNGPTGKINLLFEKEYTTFKNMTESLFSNNPEKRQKYDKR